MTYIERVAAYFKARPGEWLDGMELSKVGGRYAYRTRISDCRKLGMMIENRLRKARYLGSVYVVSEYRFMPAEDRASLAADAAERAVVAPIESL